MSRCAGILMPITALPSRYGIGTIGEEAYKFADFLKASGNTVWQILPVCPTGYGDSPYQSFSNYAGNPYMIDLDFLIEDGLLTEDDLNNKDWMDQSDKVNYAKIYQNRFAVLRIAFKRFANYSQNKFEQFIIENENWLEDYSLYMALKNYFEMQPWTKWPDNDIRIRKPQAIKKYKKQLENDIKFWKFVQFLFYSQWKNFRSYVNNLGIKLIGDMPIYVAMDSADVWANPNVFWLDEQYNPVRVAGCPPDYFSKLGQLWGNPLYDWNYLKKTDYKWWFDRIASAEKLFDITRIDHFRAFDAYYAIPYPAENAVIGDWMEGPGIEFFSLMKEKLGNVSIIAEDLGFVTDSMHKLMEASGYPGMKVLEFAFDSAGDSNHLPHCYVPNTVVYTGTHDNDTVMGWFEHACTEDVQFAKNYCNLTEEEGLNWGLIRTAYASVSNYAIIQMQDILGLGSEARFNVPSTLGGNWLWRMEKDVLTKELADKLRKMISMYSRLEDK